MNPVLLADGDWVQLLIVVAVFASWVIKHVVQGVREDAKPTARPVNVPQRRPQPQPEAQHPERPQEELDRFLEDLGIRKKDQKPRTASRPQATTAQTRRQPPQQKRQAPKQPEERRRQEVSKRHLRSRLENRRPEEMHSSLEDKHLELNVGTLAGTEGRTGAIPIGQASSGITIKRDQLLLEMLRDKDQLTRTFVMGEVFGPPISMR